MVVRSNNSSNKAEVEIISTEKVKPSIPTPPHLKTYKLSILDQLTPHIYVPLVHFYPNDDINPTTTTNSHTKEELIFGRIQILKKSLSQTLSRFYPLAGKLNNTTNDGRIFHIDCNDGVYYVEARVSDRLEKFLSPPKRLYRLLPFHPASPKLADQTYVMMIQVNIFDCGGIAISIQASHKLVDGHTHIGFLKAWAAQARASSPSLLSRNPEQEIVQIYILRRIPSHRILPCRKTLRCWHGRFRCNRASGSIPRGDSCLVHIIDRCRACQ